MPGYTGNKTSGIGKGAASDPSTIPRLEDQPKDLENHENINDEDPDDNDAQDVYRGLTKKPYKQCSDGGKKRGPQKVAQGHASSSRSS